MVNGRSTVLHCNYTSIKISFNRYHGNSFDYNLTNLGSLNLLLGFTSYGSNFDTAGINVFNNFDGCVFGT